MKKFMTLSLVSIVTSSALFSFNFDDEKFDEINRKFNNLTNNFFNNRFSNYPAMNIYERPHEYLIEVEVIGISKNDIEVSISDNQVLSISGEKNDINRTDEIPLKEERFFGKFQRQILLPKDIDSSKIDVKSESGILKIVVAKDSKKSGKRVIPIN